MYRWLDIVQSVVKRRVFSTEGDKFWSLSLRSRVNEQKLRPEYLALSLRTQCCSGLSFCSLWFLISHHQIECFTPLYCASSKHMVFKITFNL